MVSDSPVPSELDAKRAKVLGLITAQHRSRVEMFYAIERLDPAEVKAVFDKADEALRRDIAACSEAQLDALIRQYEARDGFVY